MVRPRIAVVRKSRVVASTGNFFTSPDASAEMTEEDRRAGRRSTPDDEIKADFLMQTAQNRTSRRPGAILSMELVLILPIFLLLIFSIIEFSMLMSARTRVAGAASSGARLMSIAGAGPEEVRDKVTYLLGPALAKNCEIIVEPADHAGGIGRVCVKVPMKNASPDLLWMTGFSLTHRTIETDAPMVMERSASIDRKQRM